MPESQDKWLIMRHGSFDVVPASIGLKTTDKTWTLNSGCTFKAPTANAEETHRSWAQMFGDSQASASFWRCVVRPASHQTYPAIRFATGVVLLSLDSLFSRSARLRRGSSAAAPRAAPFGQFDFPRRRSGPRRRATLATSRNSCSSSLSFLDRSLFFAK